MLPENPIPVRSGSAAGLLAPPYTNLGTVLALELEITFEFKSELRFESAPGLTRAAGLEGCRVEEESVEVTVTASAGIDRSSKIRSRTGVSPLRVGRGPRAGRVITFSGQRIGI